MKPVLFPFVHAAHPFAPLVERFRAAVDLVTDTPDVVHAEVKATETPDGGWTVNRLYWSGQRFSEGFSARTLVYDASTDAMTWHTFPRDPRLPGLCHPADAQVLRYVPLRRLTLRTIDAATGCALIAKFKRSSRLADSYDRLVRVSAAVSTTPAAFRIPIPLGLDAQRGVFFQSAEAGDDLSTSIDSHSLEGTFDRLGELHRELHELEVAGLPRWPTNPLEDLRRNVHWIAFCEPRLAGLMACVWKTALRTAPPPSPPVVCHGDLVCSQALVAHGAWTFTDFDLCHRGDAYRDVAILLASLQYDVPMLASHDLLQRATAAYLGGYARGAGHRLDESRLLWHLLLAETYYLALGFTKSRSAPDRLERAVERLRASLTQLHTTHKAAA